MLAARKAIDKVLEADERNAGLIVMYVAANLDKEDLANDPQFRDAYLLMQSKVRRGWVHLHQDRSILEAAESAASPTELARVRKVFDFWNYEPQAFLDRIRADLVLGQIRPAAQGGSSQDHDPAP